MQTGRNQAVTHAQDHFDKTADSGRPFEMPHVGFHRTDQQGFGPIPENGSQSAGFDWVADRGAGAVRLDI